MLNHYFQSRYCHWNNVAFVGINVLLSGWSSTPWLSSFVCCTDEQGRGLGIVSQILCRILDCAFDFPDMQLNFNILLNYVALWFCENHFKTCHVGHFLLSKQLLTWEICSFVAVLNSFILGWHLSGSQSYVSIAAQSSTLLAFFEIFSFAKKPLVSISNGSQGNVFIRNLSWKSVQ